MFNRFCRQTFGKKGSIRASACVSFYLCLLNSLRAKGFCFLIANYVCLFLCEIIEEMDYFKLFLVNTRKMVSTALDKQTLNTKIGDYYTYGHFLQHFYEHCPNFKTLNDKGRVKSVSINGFFCCFNDFYLLFFKIF